VTGAPGPEPAGDEIQAYPGKERRAQKGGKKSRNRHSGISDIPYREQDPEDRESGGADELFKFFAGEGSLHCGLRAFQDDVLSIAE
jgi:hypothetical protein